jgi:transposase
VVKQGFELQTLRDVPVAGRVELVWVKRHWFCDQVRCSRKTFSELTDQVSAYARSTARLCQALVAAVVVSGRAASEVARALGVLGGWSRPCCWRPPT